VSRFPVLGFDPAPGEPDELARLGRETGRAAREVDALAGEVRGLAALDDWCGVASQAFQGAVGRLPQQLEVASDAFGALARRLSEWSAALEELQVQARAAERDAAEALARLRAAHASAPSGLPTTSGGADALAAHLQAVSASRRAVDVAERALAAARSRGEAVQERAREGAARVERAVREAARSAPAEPGWLQSIGGSVVDGARRLNRQAGQFVREHRTAIAAVTDALSTAAFVAAFVPGAGTLVVLAMGAAALAGTGALAAWTEDKDAGDVALAAVGLGLGGAAAAAGRAAAAARAAETGTAVRQLPSMFSNGLSMGPREFGWRVVQLQPTLAGHAVGLVDTVSTARARGLLPPAAGAAPAGAAPRVAVRHVEPGRLVPAPGIRPAPVPVGGGR
jgi:uncharacterized protein YukE